MGLEMSWAGGPTREEEGPKRVWANCWPREEMVEGGAGSGGELAEGVPAPNVAGADDDDDDDMRVEGRKHVSRRVEVVVCFELERRQSA